MAMTEWPKPIFKALPPLSLYVHVPWCVRKCPYCDFNSHVSPSDIPERDYLEALSADLEQSLPLIWGRQIVSIFIGGGTPSLMSGAFYHELLSMIRALLPIVPNAEVTLEANPGTAEAQNFRDYHAAGINRLSLGVQSFQDELLQRVGRIHSSLEARRAFDMARSAGFERINIDLMFGLPAQTEKTMLNDLQIAVRLEPEHISWYQLTIEPNTEFAAKPPSQPETDVLAEWTERGEQWLQAHGYARYEVSAFARDNRQCLHNLNYWQFGDYLGIGAGAHSKLTLADQQSVLRTRKVKRPSSYMEKLQKTAAEWKVETPDLVFEFMLNALRLTEGVEASLFSQHTGLPITLIDGVMQALVDEGLATDWPKRIVLTRYGFDHLNHVLEYFLPEELTRKWQEVPIQFMRLSPKKGN